MKCFKLFILPCAIFTFNAAHASTEAQSVSLPFDQTALHDRQFTYDGLIFNYDLSDASNKKIVCELRNAYKGWLYFTDQGQLKESGTYGNGQGDYTVITLTNAPIQEDNYHFHVDSVGTVNIDSIYANTGKEATASCHYE